MHVLRNRHGRKVVLRTTASLDAVSAVSRRKFGGPDLWSWAAERQERDSSVFVLGSCTTPSARHSISARGISSDGALAACFTFDAPRHLDSPS